MKFIISPFKQFLGKSKKSYTILGDMLIIVLFFYSLSGLYNYVKEAAKLRLWGHIKYAFVKLEVIKMTTHTEDSSVKIRWRIRGISGSKIIFTFWRYKLLQIRDKFREEEAYVLNTQITYLKKDSLFHVRSDEINEL